MTVNTGLIISNLRCEYLSNPQGVDRLSPRLSYELESKFRNQVQTAYQILASSSMELLNQDIGNLWNSDKVLSDQTAHISYAGTTLQSAIMVFWKVRVWDKSDTPSNWSTCATWTMGLLHDTDWGGTWIGLEGTIENNYLRNANWITFPDDTTSPVHQDGQRYYRRVVSFPFQEEIQRIRFLYTGDNGCCGFINGFNLGSRFDHHRIKDQDLTFRMIPGDNVIALTGFIPGKREESGCVVGVLEVIFNNGETFIIPTDEQWKVSEVAPDGWNKPGFDDSTWKSAHILGAVGLQPLGEVRIAEDRRLPARHLRKEFTIANDIKRATLFHCGLGWSEVLINGIKINDHVLSPGLTEYEKRLFYITTDVTEQLQKNQNAIGVVLGNGRYYSPRSSVYAAMPTYGFPKLRLHLRIEHADGSIDEIVSDETWKLTDNGPILANNEFDGEEYDARKELGDWSCIRYDDSGWLNAQAAKIPSGKLCSQMIEPIRVTATLDAISLTQSKPGEYIFDLGQNITGWCQLNVKGPAGAVIYLRHAETVLPDGTLSLTNMRGAEVTDVYTLKGDGIEIWEPRFIFHGFRYVEIRGYPGNPDLHTIKGRMVHDDLRVIGTFTSSNPLLNSIYKNCVWGILGNYKSIPMDCPQRDERQGWLGDRAEVMKGESFIFDNAAFYSKWMQDIRDGQYQNGTIVDVAPTYWPEHTENVSWPSATVFITNALFEHYADKDIVLKNYECLKRWIDHMCGYLDNGIIDRDYWGDWCVPPEDLSLIHTLDPNRKTSKAVIATCYFYHDLRLMNQFARLLNYSDDATYYSNLADRMLSAFNLKFFDSKRAQYDNGSQTSYILPLAYGMVPEDQRARVFNNLVTSIEEKSKGHIGCGLIGVKYLYRVLSDNCRADLAYTIATQPDYPGYGYMLSNGATTIWELWNGDKADPWMNSGNHVMLIGDFIIWLYEYVAGIKSDPVQNGFKHVLMKPALIDGLYNVNASCHTLHGLIKSEWKNSDEKFEWHIHIPPNGSATLYIPATHVEHIYENGKSALEGEDISYARYEDGHAIFNIGSGDYSFITFKDK